MLSCMLSDILLWAMGIGLFVLPWLLAYVGEEPDNAMYHESSGGKAQVKAGSEEDEPPERRPAEMTLAA